ncbi:unnamed protein product [Boreogadus saida]
MSGGRPEKCTRAWQGASGGQPGEQAEACSGEDEDEVEGGPLLEGLEGLEAGTPREGKVEGGPLLEGLEGGTPSGSSGRGAPSGRSRVQEQDRARGPESAQGLERNVEPDGTPNSPPPL